MRFWQHADLTNFAFGEKSIGRVDDLSSQVTGGEMSGGYLLESRILLITDLHSIPASRVKVATGRRDYRARGITV